MFPSTFLLPLFLTCLSFDNSSIVFGDLSVFFCLSSLRQYFLLHSDHVPIACHIVIRLVITSFFPDSVCIISMFSLGYFIYLSILSLCTSHFPNIGIIAYLLPALLFYYNLATACMPYVHAGTTWLFNVQLYSSLLSLCIRSCLYYVKIVQSV